MAWWPVCVFTFAAFELTSDSCILSGQLNRVALKYYMDLFDYAGLRLDIAFRFAFVLLVTLTAFRFNFFFRRLCGKLYLKAETQQVDRILEQFSRRYWECNPDTLYGSASESVFLVIFHTP